MLSDDVDDVLAQRKRVGRAWWPFGEKVSATTTVATTETTTGASSQPAGGAAVEASVSNSGSITNGNETSFDINIRLVQNNVSTSQTTATSALDEAFLRKSKKLLRLLEARITERVTEMIASKVRHHLSMLLKKANKTIAETVQRPSEEPVSDSRWNQNEWAAAPASMIVPDAAAAAYRRRRARQRSVRRHTSPRKPVKENEDGELLQKLLQKIVRGDFAPLQSTHREVARGDKEKGRREYKRARRDERPAPFRWTRRREESATGNGSKHSGMAKQDDNETDDNDRRTAAHVTREGSRRNELTPGNTSRRLRRTTKREAQPVGGSDRNSDTVETKTARDAEARRENSTHIVTKEGGKLTSAGIRANRKPRPHTKHHSSRRIIEWPGNKHVKPQSQTDSMDEGINVTALVTKILKSHMEMNNNVKAGHIRSGHIRSKTITAKHGTTGMFWFYSKLKDKDARTVKFTEIFQATSLLKPKRKLPVATTTQRNSIPASVSVNGVTQITNIPASVSIEEEEDIATSSILKKRTRVKKKHSHRKTPKSQTTTTTTTARPEPTRVTSSQQTTNDQGSDVDTTVSLERSSAVTSRHSSTKKHHVKHHRRTPAAKLDLSEHRDNSKKKRHSHMAHDLSKNVFYAHWPNISQSAAAEGEIKTVITESKD